MKRLFSKKALAAVLSAGLLATSSGALSVFASNEVEHVVSQAATDADIYWNELSKKSGSQEKNEQNGNSTLSKIKVALSTAKNKVATFVSGNNSTAVKVVVGAAAAAVPAALATYFAAKGIKNYVQTGVPIDDTASNLKNDLKIVETNDASNPLPDLRDNFNITKADNSNDQISDILFKNQSVAEVCGKEFELNDNNECVKICDKDGFVSLPDGKCGCPDGTTLVDGECKDYIKSTLNGVCPSGFKWEKRFVEDRGWYNTYDDICRCNGAATLKNGKCVPYDGAKFGLNKEWDCPSDRAAKDGKCVCDSSKHFVKAADSDKCVCADGFENTFGVCVCPFGRKVEDNQCVREYINVNGQDIPLVNDQGQIYDEVTGEYLNKATGLIFKTCEEGTSAVNLNGETWCRPTDSKKKN